MKENEKKAFDFAAETTKQLITISTAIITLTVTFSKDILGGAENAPKTLLITTWLIFILSIIFGVTTLMTLTGTLQPLPKKEAKGKEPFTENNTAKQTTDEEVDKKININNSNIRLFSGLQALFFISAIVMTGLFGYKSLNNQNSIDKSSNSYLVVRKSILNGDSTKIYVDTLFLKK